MHAEAMMSMHPKVRGGVDTVLTRCIEACLDCEQVCRSCADACLSEDMVTMLRQCIRLDLDCADVPFRNFRVRWDVADPDPHHFDGNRNGIGCET